MREPDRVVLRLDGAGHALQAITRNESSATYCWRYTAASRTTTACAGIARWLT